MSGPWEDFTPPTTSTGPWADFAQGSGSPQAQTALLGDKYAQAASDELAKQKTLGLPTGYGYGDRLLNGMMFGAMPTLQAGASTPLEMLNHGTWSPSEGYNYAKAKQNLLLSNSQNDLGLGGAAADLAGGILTGSNAAKAGLTFAKAGAGPVMSALGMAGDGAAYGGLTGFNSNEGAGRFTGAAQGAGMGAAAGGALGGALAATSPLISNIAARMNPAKFAAGKVAGAMQEGGYSPQDMAAALQSASNDGQSSYTLADAMGTPGQRLLSTVARAPGDGRTAAYNYLENRQADQASRLGNILSEGLQAPLTADQATSALTKLRTTTADTNYDAARMSGGPVDVTSAIQAADNYLTPGANSVVSTPSGITDNSIASAVAKAKGFLTDGKSNVSDFSQALQAKHEIQNIMDSGSPAQAKFVKPIKDALDNQLAASSSDYANARNTFRQQSGAIDAIPQGVSAAKRGRPEDTMGTYLGMPPSQQAAFRVGYADPTIENIANAPPGVNKARMLMGDGPQHELGTMSQFTQPNTYGPSNAMQTRIGRENTMFDTRQTALGGSKTADNLADAGDLSHAAGIATNLLHGNLIGAAAAGLRGAGNLLTANTPEVRNQLAKLLLMHGQSAPVASTLQNSAGLLARNATLAKLLRSGVFASTDEAQQYGPSRLAAALAAQ